MRTIGVVTTSRSDYGIYQPVLRAMQADSRLRMGLIVAGMHLAPQFGPTVEAVRACKGSVKPRLTVYPATDHFSWIPAYDDPAFWRWIAEQRRPAR